VNRGHSHAHTHTHSSTQFVGSTPLQSIFLSVSFSSTMKFYIATALLSVGSVSAFAPSSVARTHNDASTVSFFSVASLYVVPACARRLVWVNDGVGLS
jgi:hypothetical protein